MLYILYRAVLGNGLHVYHPGRSGDAESPQSTGLQGSGAQQVRLVFQLQSGVSSSAKVRLTLLQAGRQEERGEAQLRGSL